MSSSTYNPLTIESFTKAIRNNPPPGENLSLWDDDAILEWAEVNPDYSTYFKSHIANPKPNNLDGSPEPWHDTSIPVGESMPNPLYVQDYADYKASKDPDHLKYLGFKDFQLLDRQNKSGKRQLLEKQLQ